MTQLRRKRGSGPTVSRRQVIVGAVALGLLPGHALVANDAPSNFLRLSQELTGRTDLSALLAEAFLHATLDDHETAPAMRRFLKTGVLAPADRSVLQPAILRQWYTGLVATRQGPKVETYDGALVWDAMGFDRPIGTCRDTVGSWSEPPTP